MNHHRLVLGMKWGVGGFDFWDRRIRHDEFLKKGK